MRNVKLIISLTTIFIIAIAFHVNGQSRPEKTASAKAYYGYSTSKPKFKKQKKLKVHNTHTKKSKAIRLNARSMRKKISHS